MVEHGGVVSVLACVRSDTLSGVGPVHSTVLCDAGGYGTPQRVGISGENHIVKLSFYGSC